MSAVHKMFCAKFFKKGLMEFNNLKNVSLLIYRVAILVSTTISKQPCVGERESIVFVPNFSGHIDFQSENHVFRSWSVCEQDISKMKSEVNHLGSENSLTKLVVDLSNTHPDDAFSSIPYEKGHTFLRYLENTVGGPDKFEPFLRKYFDTYKFKSIDTNEFKSFFENYFNSNKNIQEIDWNTWLYKPGMPPIIPQYDMTLAETCTYYKDRWLNWNETEDNTPPFTKEDIQVLSSNQIIQLLQEILDSKPQSEQKLKILEETLGFDTTENSEIKFRWLRIGLKAHWKDIVERALNWVNTVGRMKFVRPIYRDLYNWKEVRDTAIANFIKQRDCMMHVSDYTISKDLHLN